MRLYITGDFYTRIISKILKNRNFVKGECKKMDKVKDIVFDKIVDEILDVIVGKSKSEIENLISQNRNQKIFRWY